MDGDRRPDYEDLEASELYCPSCRRSRPVRKHLLLILPGGEKYDYRCSACGTPVGTKTTRGADAPPSPRLA